MDQQGREIVSKLLKLTENGFLDWHPTDVRGTYYSEFGSIPYIVGLDAIVLDDSHQCLAYFVMAKQEIWERMAYAQEDDYTFELDEKDKEISRLFNEASAQSYGKEMVPLNGGLFKENNDIDTHRKPKIFISHSSNDKLFVSALYSLLLAYGFTKEDIFCSSIQGSWIPVGRKIFDTLREQFYQNDLYVLFVHSPRLYRSPISMNEMGAAWALRTQYYSVLTKDMSVDAMEAVVDKQEIAVKVSDKNAVERTMELMKILQNIFGKEPSDEMKSRKLCETFVEYTNGIYHIFGSEKYFGNFLEQVFNQVIRNMIPSI